MRTLYELRGVLRPLDGSALVKYDTADLVENYRTLVQIFNGDFCSARLEAIYNAPSRLVPGVDYRAVLCPITQGREMYDYYGKSFFEIFPRGQTLRLCVPRRKTEAHFTVESYGRRQYLMWQKLETVVALAVNHHLDGAQASQFEEFYDKKLRDGKLFYSKMEETTVAGQPLDMEDRLRNLRDGFSIVFRTREREQVLDWWVGRNALWLNTSVPSNMTDISIFRHSELGGEDRLHQVRMDIAAAQAEMLMGAFHDEVLMVMRSDCPEERVSQLISEGMPLQEALAQLDEEFPAPQRISVEDLRSMPEEKMQSWYLVGPHKSAGA